MANKIPVDEELLEKLAMIHCSNKEIAAILNISVDTLDRRFADLVAKGRDKGKGQLRRAQWQLAMEKHNCTMLIFLGKQILGQSDKVEQVTNMEAIKEMEQVMRMDKEAQIKALKEALEKLEAK